MSSLDLGKFPALKSAADYSDNIYKNLQPLNEKYAGTGVCLAIIGSLGRKEATAESDFDVYPIANQTLKDKTKVNLLWNEAAELSRLKNPSTTGNFGSEKLTTIDDIKKNIGGENDSNSKISQRILIILESKFIGDLCVRDEAIIEIVSRYIDEKTTNHQLGMFVLNDIIRFYRTMCVDFEYKTYEDKKPWAVRNLKLVFSRKLIYFSGILMCGELAQASSKQKREIFKRLMQLTPTERILEILGNEAERPLKIYDEFMQKMSDGQFRRNIHELTADARGTSDDFTDLKNRSHHFGWALRAAFNRHYDSTHPIHRAIMF